MDSLKTWAEIVEAGATTIALIAAGIWSYLLFVRQRQRFPRAEVSHRVACLELMPDNLLVHVCVVVKNLGSVLIRLREGHVQVQKVRPLPPEMAKDLDIGADLVAEGCSEVEWPVVGRHNCNWSTAPHEVEPGESDEFHFDFTVPTSTQTVEVYSYFRNTLKGDREIGWNHTTLVELSECRIAPKRQIEGEENAESTEERRERSQNWSGATKR